MAGAVGKAGETVIPIHVLGGFLGSGKTTLLTRLLAAEKASGGHAAVLVNEVGEADVDGRTVHDHHSDVELLAVAGGCVCCDLVDDLALHVRELLARPDVTALYVETTGLAALGPVAAIVASAAAASGRGALASVLALVDTPRLARTEAEWAACDGHLEGADTVLLNHWDEADAAERRYARAWVATRAPRARVLETVFADPGEAGLKGLLGNAFAGERRAPPGGDSTRGYTTAGFFLQKPLDLRRLEALVARYERSLVRLKGFVRTPDGSLLELQAGAGVLRVTPHPGAVERPFLVAIGRRLPWERFMDALGDCLVRAPRRRASRTTAAAP